MSTITKDFEEFMKRRAKAANAYVNGDAKPLSGLTAQKSPATFFGPGGGFTQGAGDVQSRYEKDAKSFEPGGDSELEILQMGAGDGVGYWTGFQKATVRMPGKPDPIPMKLRITEVFRREEDEWKLVHRHADMLAEEQPKK
ncbi:MAG: nuclear transport factor 2 family protein [Capsulimonas sp.]|uniref:YybH family protein n=1 Tax=Capsulimonas sp. TaxID=2494211 RepID=UPI003263FDE1